MNLHVESHSSIEESILATGPAMVLAPVGGHILPELSMAEVTANRDGRYRVRAHIVATVAPGLHMNANLKLANRHYVWGLVSTSNQPHPETDVFLDLKSGDVVQLATVADDTTAASYVTTLLNITLAEDMGCRQA